MSSRPRDPLTRTLAPPAQPTPHYGWRYVRRVLSEAEARAEVEARLHELEAELRHLRGDNGENRVT
jgi:hypothetical protein